MPDLPAPVLRVFLDDAFLPAGTAVAELSLKQVTAAHRFEARNGRKVGIPNLHGNCVRMLMAYLDGVDIDTAAPARWHRRISAVLPTAFSVRVTECFANPCRRPNNERIAISVARIASEASA